jgi:hypothetical protein
MYNIDVPAPDEINYHEARQVQRVEQARKQLDPGDVLAVIDSRIASEPDPKAHPLYQLVCWHLSKGLTPVDGGQFFDTFNRMVMAAVDTCLDELLADPSAWED